MWSWMNSVFVYYNPWEPYICAQSQVNQLAVKIFSPCYHALRAVKWLSFHYRIKWIRGNLKEKQLIVNWGYNCSKSWRGAAVPTILKTAIIQKQTQKFPAVYWVNVLHKPESHQYCISAKITWNIHIFMCWLYQTSALMMTVTTSCQQSTKNLWWYLLSKFVLWLFNKIFFNTISFIFPFVLDKRDGVSQRAFI